MLPDTAAKAISWLIKTPLLVFLDPTLSTLRAAEVNSRVSSGLVDREPSEDSWHSSHLL